MRILTLAGWGQPHDALASILPEATHLNYVDYPTLDVALSAIADNARHHDAVVGWSLGGQLAVLAIARKLMQPEKLVLIGTPFQFVRGNDTHGMPQDTYKLFRDNFAKAPERTLRKAWELIAYQDQHEERVRSQLHQKTLPFLLEKNWLLWLDLLEGFNCEGLPFSHFPPTLLIHGDQDNVVHKGQAQLFARSIPRTKVEIWSGCGHAPHWHDAPRVQKEIQEFLHV